VNVLITTHDDKPPISVDDEDELIEALSSAADEARSRGMLAAIIIETETKNSMTMVVGSSETVLTFFRFAR